MYSPYNEENEASILANLVKRAEFKRDCETNLELQAHLFEMCKRDPKFFFDYFLFTVKNDTMFSQNLPFAIPFVLFDYQRELVDLIQDGIMRKRNIFCEKSRQMSFTWIMLGMFLWGFLFHNHRYLIISRTADEVDKKWDINSCFERMRFMLDLIPNFLLPKWFDRSSGWENNKYMAISSSSGPASITGESANPDAWRGGTYTAIFMDEMAFMKDAVAINKACASATSCRIMNSTPNGEGNEYYRMRLMAMDQLPLPYDARMILAVTLHWSLHPYYTREWYDQKIISMTPEGIEQELEINYNVAVEWRVYKRFALPPVWDVEMGDYNYDYTLPTYVSIDNSHGGNDPHAAIVFQTDSIGNMIIIDAVQTNMSISEMANLLAKHPLPGQMDTGLADFYSRWMTYKKAIFIGDPYDTNATWNDTSIANEYRKVGITISVPMIAKWVKGNIAEQIRITQQNLSRIKVSLRCTEFISAIQNAKYPTRKETSTATTENIKPIHDWTSHFRTALEYWVLFLVWNEADVKPKKVPKLRAIADYITGEMRYTEY